ncbi:hypothetical protein JOE69_000480 [Arthrobacter russicus]|uniref:Uncharacterized protein n=1 Tax=Arthrobacter russicus TaxID=172040 RepID=A0ABU1J740_9MICC|nr:hypothetical protein [Arthrobacter russicus]
MGSFWQGPSGRVAGYPPNLRAARRNLQDFYAFRLLRGLGWHTGHRYEDRFMNGSRRIRVSSPLS